MRIVKRALHSFLGLPVLNVIPVPLALDHADVAAVGRRRPYVCPYRCPLPVEVSVESGLFGGPAVNEANPPPGSRTCVGHHRRRRRRPVHPLLYLLLRGLLDQLMMLEKVSA